MARQAAAPTIRAAVVRAAGEEGEGVAGGGAGGGDRTTTPQYLQWCVVQLSREGQEARDEVRLCGHAVIIDRNKFACSCLLVQIDV